MSVQAVPAPAAKPFVSGFHVAFVVAWAICLLFYFLQYAVRSAPSVMLPELTAAYGLIDTGHELLARALLLYLFDLRARLRCIARSLGREIHDPDRDLLSCGRPHDVRRRRELDGVLSAVCCRGPAPLLPSSAPCIWRLTVFPRVISRPRSASPNAWACSADRPANSVSRRWCMA